MHFNVRFIRHTLAIATLTFLTSIAAADTVLPRIGEDLNTSSVVTNRSRTLLSGTWNLTAKATPIPVSAPHPHAALYAVPEPLTTATIPVQVPGVWQNQGLGYNYHGTAIYTLDFDVPREDADKRTWLHFERVASITTVTLNGHILGSHTGAWTPFDFYIYPYLKAGKNHLSVEVAEAGEHYTSGFIKSIANSFGGIWGDVWLEQRPNLYIQDAFAWLDAETSAVKVRTVLSDVYGGQFSAIVQVTLLDSEGTSVGQILTTLDNAGSTSGPIELSITPDLPLQLWQPDQPTLYTVEVKVGTAIPTGTGVPILSETNPIDSISFRTGFRTTTMDADHLYINGQPTYWASILHWACYPKYLAPFLGREEFRAEIRKLKQCGYNSINVCLFMFPPRYYEVADVEGMMLWQEYPLWFYFIGVKRPETPAERRSLVREFEEMFMLDRNHPSVILRSMACEDPTPDLPMMKFLYDLCHEMIPGSLAQDNTAFLDQHFADFLDMHPYEESEVYPQRMKEWTIKSRKMGDKPFLFGESFDNDTFRDFDAIEAAGPDQPWWTDPAKCQSLVVPASSGLYWEQLDRVRELKKIWGDDVLKFLVKNSADHAFQTRKYQLEQSRLYKFFAGASITAIVDTICTRPGIFDELHKLKWQPDHLATLNQQTLIIFDAARQSRCYTSGEHATGTIHLSHYLPEKIRNADITVTITGESGNGNADTYIAPFKKTFSVTADPGFVGTIGDLDYEIPAVEKPTMLTLTASMPLPSGPNTNTWILWVYPSPPINPLWENGLPATASTDSDSDIAQQKVRVVNTLTTAVLDYVKQGGKVILLQKRGMRPGLPAHNTAFWREVALLHHDKDLFADFPWQQFIDHQFLGLEGTHALDIDSQPDGATTSATLLRTINCRHMQENDYIREFTLGKGQLIATTFTLQDNENPTGIWLLNKLAQRLTNARPE